MTHSKQNGATITLKKSATLPSAEPLSSIMTIIKIISTFIILFFVSQASISQTTTINFEWSNDSLNGLLFEKTAMHIPIHFENDTNTYYFQLDTGSDQTFLYSYDSLQINLPLSHLTENVFKSDIGLLNVVKLNTKKCYLEDGRLHIGTLGADFFTKKIVEIDFPMQQIRFLPSYDSTSFKLKAMKLSYGRPIIQIESQNKTYDFLFDTGSSLFELWTTKSIWNKFREKSSNVDEFPISSWGKINTAYRTTLNRNFSICFCNSIKIKHIWYNSNKNFAQGFRSLIIDGIIGNKPFLDQILLIDFENKKIGVKQCI